MIAIMFIGRDFQRSNSGICIHGAFSLRTLISDQEHILKATCTHGVRDATNVSHRLRVSLSAIRRVVRVMTISHLSRVSSRLPTRLLGLVAFLAASMLAAQSAQALSPIHPSGAVGSKTVAGGVAIQVRSGHGGSGGQRGAVGGGRSFSAPVVRSPSFSAGPAVATGGPRFVGRPAFVHRRHGAFVGGVYYDDYPTETPYDDDYPVVDSGGNYPAIVEGDDGPPAGPVFVTVPRRGCRLVVTAYGPRVYCQQRIARRHHVPPRHQYHRVHHAKR
jgi:hypothetical protein